MADVIYGAHYGHSVPAETLDAFHHHDLYPPRFHVVQHPVEFRALVLRCAGVNIDIHVFQIRQTVPSLHSLDQACYLVGKAAQLPLFSRAYPAVYPYTRFLKFQLFQPLR